METLLGLALKSLLIAGATLALLHFTRNRSSAERSWIAHLGLVALVALPLASLALPALHVNMPAAFTPTTEVASPLRTAPDTLPSAQAPSPTATIVVPEPASQVSSAEWASYAYAVPAIALLLITILALLRLFALRHRAQVLVDPVWLSALAHAQRRMGFKNGTALLTSNELSSPISWGLMRPVILLNDEALEASGEAEAIIAHELAHVARLDWAKLMLARVATAIFWFNPLAWVLAREAHQLREEAADDAVLAANIADTDYAQLLVGIARHECKGLLLGAHGISPGKDSLRRRVRRVLDGTLARGPAQRSWVAGFAAGMLVMAAPLAALTFAPKAADRLSDEDVARADGVAAADDVAGAAADIAEAAAEFPFGGEGVVSGSNGSSIVTSSDGTTVMRNASGGTITVYAPDARGRRPVVMLSPSGATTSYADARNVPGLRAVAFAAVRGGRPDEGDSDNAIDELIEMKVLGITPAYAASIRAAAPQLRNIDADELSSFKVHGVTPQLVQTLVDAGYRDISADEIVDAVVMGVTPAYIRELAAVGYRGLSMEELTEMKTMGVTSAFIEQFRRAGYPRLSVDKIVELRVLGVQPRDVNRPRSP